MPPNAWPPAFSVLPAKEKRDGTPRTQNFSTRPYSLGESSTQAVYRAARPGSVAEGGFSESFFPCSRVDRFLCAPHNQANSRNCSICGKYLFESIAKQTAPRQAEERKYIRGGHSSPEVINERRGEEKNMYGGAVDHRREGERGG